MKKRAQIIPNETVTSRILTIRGQKVIIDASLAEIYGVQTKELNRAVKRNSSRFPIDFVFQLTLTETESLRCQIGTSNEGRGGRRFRPYAFTENGAVMAANVLNSRQAARMSVFVVRAFAQIAAQRAPALEPLHFVTGSRLAACPSPRYRATCADARATLRRLEGTRHRAETTRSETDFPPRYSRERHRRRSPPHHGAPQSTTRSTHTGKIDGLSYPDKAAGEEVTLPNTG